jgi:hypothetical protein
VSSSLPIVADIRSDAPGLGFAEYSSALAEAIRGGEPAQFTIGLYGAWGTGKSSLLKGISAELASSSKPGVARLPRNAAHVIVVEFDAWRFERSEQIVVPLLHAIVSKVDRVGDRPLAEQLKRALGAVLFSLRFDVLGVGVDLNEVKANWDAGQLTPLDDAFSRPFAELQAVSQTLGKRRIAVLIDDLDRCSPERVVSVLEAINLVMDVPGFIFVLALDYNVLVQAVEKKYPHVEGHDFIQKIVQLPFRVPPLNLDAPTFLDELIPQWPAVRRRLPAGVGDAILKIARQGLEGNPRQIKRLVNSILLISSIVERRALEIDHELMASVVGLQLGWPGRYQDLQDSVFSGDEDPLQALAKDKEDSDLVGYARDFLSGRGLSLEDLEAVLRLTAVVSASEPDRPSAIGPMSEAREWNRENFVHELAARGFSRSTRSERLYYNARMPDLRFVMGKHVVRFEKRDGDGWSLWESYLLSRETDLALKVIDAPNRRFTTGG